MFTNKNLEAFKRFAQEYNLTEYQLYQFQRYAELLIQCNEKYNLTTITSVNNIIEYHFKDSLKVAHYVDFSTPLSIVDIGSGAGFPGIPLKICYPESWCILIEVTRKKINFLESILDELNLDIIQVYPLDWRTFLRKTEHEIDYFFARASLDPAELVRMFKLGCYYKNSKLVYWASQQWLPDDKLESLIVKSEEYIVGHKKRKLVFFQRP